MNVIKSLCALLNKPPVLIALAASAAIVAVMAGRSYLAAKECYTARCMLKQDKSFSAMFRPDVPVLVHEKNSAPLYAMDPAFKGDAAFRHMIDALSRHVENMDETAPASPSCAVVGNSQILKESNYGAQIDSHDFVYRMNSAPVEGYADDVGSKTTHHVFSHIFAGNYRVNGHTAIRPYSPDTRHIIIPLQDGSREDFNKSTGNHNAFKRFYASLAKGLSNDASPRPPLSYDEMAQLRDVPNLVSLTPDFLWYVNKSWFTPKKRDAGDIASTGLVVLVMALHQCDRVDVYGFGSTPDGAWGKYFDASEDRPGRHRPGYQEYLLKQLQRSGVIRVRKGKCCDISVD